MKILIIGANASKAYPRATFCPSLSQFSNFYIFKPSKPIIALPGRRFTMHSDVYNEKELLTLVSKGDEAAFAIIFRRHHRKIYQVARMLTGSEPMAEELVQEVFLKVWAKRESLSGIDNLEAWLFIVARNDALKALKRSVRLHEIHCEIKEEATVTNETEELIQFRNFRELLNEAVDRLPPRQQTAWRLSKDAGLNREEIAERMQIRPDTVKEHMAMALKNIRAYLKSSGPQAHLQLLMLCALESV